MKSKWKKKKKRCWNIQFGSCLFGNERNPWKERWRGRKKLSDRGRRRWLSGGAAGVRKWWAILLYHRIPSPPAAPLTAIWQQQTISNCFLHEGERWVFPSNGGKQTGSKQFDWQTESVRLHLFRLMRSRKTYLEFAFIGTGIKAQWYDAADWGAF